MVTMQIDLLPKTWIKSRVPNLLKAFRRIFADLDPERMLEEDPEHIDIYQDLYQGVMSLRYLKQSISTKKLALIDQYGDLFDLSKRCLTIGTEIMVVYG